MGRRAVVAGSFDPITNGHLDIITRGAGLFDEVVVACGHNVNKRYAFELKRRIELIVGCTSHLPGVRVDTFEGLLVDYCARLDADVILRGLRATTDFDFEFQIGLANMDMAPDVQTVFLLSPPHNIFVSSSLVKEIAVNGGDVSRYVPPAVNAALIELYAD
ncbi:MAG: pantetheine-phosphate adenylyltransferase [Proteobacteria bacterium]|nr:pantetheine-phosphate adenylyltransferase [Pseudomonadota bacterium]MCP4919233.1 pantetheine-phosphate adenylyltransferase [Pseudomonadota bacterium]